MNPRDARSLHRIDQARAGVLDGRYDDPAVLDKAITNLLNSGDLDIPPHGVVEAQSPDGRIALGQVGNSKARETSRGSIPLAGGFDVCPKCGALLTHVPGHMDGDDADGNRGRWIEPAWCCTGDDCCYSEPDDGPRVPPLDPREE